MSTPQLVKVLYRDEQRSISLKCYADAIAYQKNKGGDFELAAIRFGGYPEQVKAMADAIYGGGDIRLESNGNIYIAHTLAKRYHKTVSMDGLYAEALLYLKDDPQIAMSNDNGTSEQTVVSAPTNCYIITPPDDRDRLFEEIDLRTGVPLISDFRDYFLDALIKEGFLLKYSVFSINEKFDLWRLIRTDGDKNLIRVLENGLKDGSISIPGATPENSMVFEGIGTISQYLHEFGVTIAERIKGQFNPLFDPSVEALSQQVLSVNENIRKNCGYSLYDAQLATAEAVKRKIDRHEPAVIVAECGAGKTKIGAAALYASHLAAGKEKTFNIILCPGHVANKWTREIKETIPDSSAAVIRSITDMRRFYRSYERGSNTAFAVFSKERARDGYSRYPSVIWSKVKKAFICPQCGEPVMVMISENGVRYKSSASAVDFLKETRNNHRCDNCHAVLWAPLMPEMQTDWVKIGGFGFVHRKFASSYLGIVPTGDLYDEVVDICREPNAFYKAVGAVRRFALSSYVKRKMKGKIDGLIADELHQYAQDSGQGDAMGELVQSADKVIGMTATLINGYASGIFHLLYRLVPHLMELDGQKHSSPGAFAGEYGVTETVYEIETEEYSTTRRSTRRKLRDRQLPGISPLVYTRFLMETAVFLSLADMGKALPEYEEIPIELEMRGDIQKEYERLEDSFRKVMRDNRKIARKVMSAFMNLLTVYPDQPYDQRPILHPKAKDVVIAEPVSLSCFDDIHQKEEKLLELVDQKMHRGERVLIYTSWTRIDTQKKLLRLFEDRGYKAAALTVKLSPEKREEWVEKQLMAGVRILITNPSLVETGLDLNAFTTLIFYNIAYNLFTLRQASRRSWRINQTAPRIEVYFFFYKGTMQARAMRLMASKLMAAGILEGNVTDEGLAAMSDCADLTTQLAREITMGIRDEVEDLAAVFKKMAVLKPKEQKDEDRQSEAVNITEPAPAVILPLFPAAGGSLEEHQFIFASSGGIRRRKQPDDVIEDQISLFDLSA